MSAAEAVFLGSYTKVMDITTGVKSPFLGVEGNVILVMMEALQKEITKLILLRYENGIVCRATTYNTYVVPRHTIPFCFVVFDCHFHLDIQTNMRPSFI